MHATLCFLLFLLDPSPLERVGRLDHPPIREASGIVASRKHPGIFWVHNDSGNPPALFAVRRDGSLVREYAVGAPNIDWEDIAIDDQDRLYLGDIGNNLGRLPVRLIYRLDEPDPGVAAEKPLEAVLVAAYKLPKDDRFDAEALVVDGSRAMIATKRRDGRLAELYEVPLDPAASVFRPVEPVRIGPIPGFTEPVTGADLSADGEWLAVCSLNVVRVYRRRGELIEPAGSASYDADGVEAVCWDGTDLILASEGRSMYRVRADLRKAVR